jgi:hypothetical protein
MNFQSDFFTHYVEKKMRLLKFETTDYNFLMIRIRKTAKDFFLIDKTFKSLEVEIPFDENRYKELYPFENEYPLKGCLKPILKEAEFNNFVFEMIMQGLIKCKEQNAPIPCDFLINIVLDFKANGFKNEWVHKARTFKDHFIKASLCCKLTCNYFSLELVIEKNKKEVFRKEILKTLPSSIMYKYKFKDIIVEDNVLKVTTDDLDNPILFEFDLLKLALY